MNEILVYLCVIIIGYLFGSIPFGLILAKVMGYGDIRKIGSGNIGATNALRTGSKKLALLTVLCDIAKGTLPVVICKYILPEAIVLVAVGAILGHCYPVWLNFKGGKGMATTVGVILGIHPIIFLGTGLTWLFLAFTSKTSSLSSLIAALLTPFYTYLMLGTKEALLTCLITIIVWIRHKDNIIRIFKNEEKKIGDK